MKRQCRWLRPIPQLLFSVSFIGVRSARAGYRSNSEVAGGAGSLFHDISVSTLESPSPLSRPCERAGHKRYLCLSVQTDIPGGDVTNPTHARFTSHRGTLTTSTFWGEATVPSQAHRGHSRLKNYPPTSAAPTCCSCHSRYNPGARWLEFSFRTVLPAQTSHPFEEPRIPRSSGIP